MLPPTPANIYFFKHVNFLVESPTQAGGRVEVCPHEGKFSLGLRDWVSWWNHWSYWSSKCGPAVAASHGNLLEMQNSHPKTMESETLRMGYRNPCFNKFSCGFWCLLKFEKHWWKESGITAKDQESEGKELFYHHGPPLKSQSCQASLHLYICRRSRERHYFLVFSGAENIRKSFGY